MKLYLNIIKLETKIIEIEEENFYIEFDKLKKKYIINEYWLWRDIEYCNKMSK